MAEEEKTRDQPLESSRRKVELPLFLRKLTCMDNTLLTKEISDLKDQAQGWLDRGNCGALIFGEPRIGKTSGMYYIMNEIRKKYGEKMPLFYWSYDSHSSKGPSYDREVCMSIMRAMNLPSPNNRATIQDLKRLIINTMRDAGKETKYRNVILIVDEAQQLNDRDYVFLIDLYNTLHVDDISLITLLVGQPELKEIRNAFRNNRKDQIVGRFMNVDFRFTGIKNVQALACVLRELELKHDYGGELNDVHISEDFFPESIKKGRTIVDMAYDFWTAFEEVGREHGAVYTDVPMQYIMQALAEVIRVCSVQSTCSRENIVRGALPGIGFLKKVIIDIGYLSRGPT